MLPEQSTIDRAAFPAIVQALLHDSEERWMSKKDRSQSENGILICVDPPHAFRLTNGYNTGTTGWCCEEGVLSGHELAEFFGKFGSGYSTWLKASFIPQQWPVRAFIKDGEDEWTWSVDVNCGEPIRETVK